MKIYDISASIYTGMAVYKNKPEKQPAFHTVTSGHVTETRIELDCHTGTHVDAPLHMKPEGETMESIALERLVRNVKVIDVTKAEDAILPEHLENKEIKKGDFILFKTRNSFTEEFDFNFVFLEKNAAKLLADQGIEGVGIDALGVERSQENHPTHKTLFENDILIIEGLRLKDVPEGEYLMAAAPLKLIGTDASPARAILIQQ